MRASATARRYAEAAFDVARQAGQQERWLQDLRAAVAALSDTDLYQYFRDPNVGQDERMETLERAFGRLQPEVVNLMRILSVRQRLHLLPSILREFEDLDRAARGVTEAHVTVARDVDPQERESIARGLAEAVGKKVELHFAVDPAILGGIVVRIGDRLVDASVAGRLQRLRQELV